MYDEEGNLEKGQYIHDFDITYTLNDILWASGNVRGGLIKKHWYGHYGHKIIDFPEVECLTAGYVAIKNIGRMIGAMSGVVLSLFL